jgi:hypothetical protein
MAQPAQGLSLFGVKPRSILKKIRCFGLIPLA